MRSCKHLHKGVMFPDTRTNAIGDNVMQEPFVVKAISEIDYNKDRETFLRVIVHNYFTHIDLLSLGKGNTIFHYMAKDTTISEGLISKVVKWLGKDGLNQTNDDGLTVMMLAAEYGNIAMFDFILSKFRLGNFVFGNSKFIYENIKMNTSLIKSISKCIDSNKVKHMISALYKKSQGRKGAFNSGLFTKTQLKENLMNNKNGIPIIFNFLNNNHSEVFHQLVDTYLFNSEVYGKYNMTLTTKFLMRGNCSLTAFKEYLEELSTWGNPGGTGKNRPTIMIEGRDRLQGLQQSIFGEYLLFTKYIQGHEYIYTHANDTRYQVFLDPEAGRQDLKEVYLPISPSFTKRTNFDPYLFVGGGLLVDAIDSGDPEKVAWCLAQGEYDPWREGKTYDESKSLSRKFIQTSFDRYNTPPEEVKNEGEAALEKWKENMGKIILQLYDADQANKKLYIILLSGDQLGFIDDLKRES